ncbi:MAG: hypothetical protein H0U71_08480 [Gammaproteobacteria bacterium]|nr:hypothetical protein [Gammaproteobacteria bacterium]
MSTYSVYNNILIKLENVFLRVEMEVDAEITSLLTQHNKLNGHLVDLKEKVESLNALKRSCDLYCNDPVELESLNRDLFTTLCNKKIKLRFLQEKELLLNSHLSQGTEAELPTLIQINKEFKLRKNLQEIELLSSFLTEDQRFSPYIDEINCANEMFDLAIESGATDKLENTISLFNNLFEKALNIFELELEFKDEFKKFAGEISLQASAVSMLNADDITSRASLQTCFKYVRDERIKLELEVDKLLYQFAMFQNGKKIIIAEAKNASGELESILFKEYAIKQKIQELKQYKIELNSQKDSFMKDPTIDGYTEAVQQLESVESRFRRLMMHKNFDKNTIASRFFATTKAPAEPKVGTPYNKILFQVLHNSHIASQDKMVILRLSKSSKMLNTNSGKLFFQRTGKTRSLQTLEATFEKFQTYEVH